MKLVGFNLTKVNLEKKSDNLKDLKITTGINILEIQEVKNSFLKTEDELISIKFEYSVNYEKDIAFLNLFGSLLLSIESKQTKEILKQWKEKKIPEDFKLNLFNLVMKKSILKALKFEEELNLPPHIPFPSFKPQDKNKQD